MFSKCNSLISLPDISKWNINKVRYMSYIFSECYSLGSLPDISKWNNSNATPKSSGIFPENNFINLLPRLSNLHK